MRVAMVNREPLPAGGDGIALNFLIPALRGVGVDVEHLYGGELSGRLRAFDLVHVFHLNVPFARQNFEAVRASGRPYVVTPIFFREVALVPLEDQRKWLDGAGRIMPFSLAERADMVAQLGANWTFEIIPNGTDPKFHANPSSDRIGIFCRLGSLALSRPVDATV